MKTYIKSIIAGMFTLIMVSCQKDLLDTYPTDSLNNANFWKSEEDAINAVNAIYSMLPGIAETEWDMMTDIGSTNAITNAKSVGVERGAPSADMNYFENLWDDAYRAVRAVNYFLENADKVKEADPTMSDALLDRLKSEARFIRAFYYTRLVMLYGDVPLITKALTLQESYEVARTPKEQVWDFVESELTEIANILPPNYTGNDIGRITKGAALAMKARAMLYAGRWDKAATAAQAVMGMGYSLYPNYQNLFSYAAENNSEVILDRQYAKDVNPSNFFNTYAPRGMNGGVGIAPTRTLVDAYETINGLSIDDDPLYNPLNPYANRDPRMRFSLFLPAFSDAVPGDIMYNGKVYDSRPGSKTADEVDVDFQRSKTGYNTKKYINPEDMNDRNNCGTNFILIRYADVLLMYAEAKIELDQIDETVYKAINDVRNQRLDVKLPDITIGKTQPQLREIVRHERMVELAMEGLRFFDIRRWKTAENLMQGPVPGIRYIPKGGSTVQLYAYGAVVRYFDPARDYLFPIPQHELILNPNLAPQNPEY